MNAIYNEIKEKISLFPYISSVGNIEKCTVAAGSHIEIEVFAKDTQEARKLLQEDLDNLYPHLKFRFVFFKAQA